MRAVRVVRTNGQRSLEVAEIADPIPGANDVLIEVEAVGINFPDLLLSRGMYQREPELPFILGTELSGIVLSAPSGSEFSQGQRVSAITSSGAMAQRAVAPAEHVLPLPDTVSFAAGACIPVNYLTMSFGLLTRGALESGETVLVHGAAGGIGTASTQLAKAYRARVLAVVSTEEKAEFVRSIGADEVIDVDGFKDAALALTDGRGVDVVVDPVGGDRFTDSLRSLAPMGRLLVIGFAHGEIPMVKVNRLLLNNIDIRGVGWGAYAYQRPGYLRKEWDKLLPLLRSGVVAPPIFRSYSFEHAGEALAALEARTVLGKIVVMP